jgi:nucleoid-associated protein YgaU
MKHNVGDVARLTSQVEALEKELAEAKKHIAKLSEANKALLSDKATMSEEIKNVRKMVSGLGAEDSASDGPKDLAALKDLDKDDDKKEDFSVPDEVLKLDSEAEEKSVEVVSEDVKEKTEDPFLAKKGFVGKKDENSSAAVTEKPALVEKPEFYVVKEGDTLYKIAVRFYGKSSAWRIVRDANKTVISTDGRIKVGQKIRLP